MPNLSKELRKQRRREEHKARKAANRAGLSAVPADQQQPRQAESLSDPFTVRASNPQSLPEFHALADRKIADPEAENARENDLNTARADRNRRNAQLSTGPKTAEGKARASQNAVRHGLSSDNFLILDWENLDDFAVLLVNLRAEHQPATQTEALLVERMAQHFWLSQRALRLQDMCLNRDLPVCEEPKQMALYMRYGVTHDRAFHKCLAELLKLRAVQRKEEAGFVSQQRQAAAERRKEELHSVRVAAATPRQPPLSRKIPALYPQNPSPLPCPPRNRDRLPPSRRRNISNLPQQSGPKSPDCHKKHF